MNLLGCKIMGTPMDFSVSLVHITENAKNEENVATKLFRSKLTFIHSIPFFRRGGMNSVASSENENRQRLDLIFRVAQKIRHHQVSS